MIRKFLGSKEHLDWHKIDLNVAEIITVQDYKQKKINVNRSTHIRVKSHVYDHIHIYHIDYQLDHIHFHHVTEL